MLKYVAMLLTLSGYGASAQTYDPPVLSKSLLGGAKLSSSRPLDEDYRLQFVGCDGMSTTAMKDHFRGHDLIRPNTPQSKQYYLCSRDPSRVKALLKLGDGGILWESKMALDVDGAWAAWNGVPGATDLKETAYKWPNVRPTNAQKAQLDPDKIPFVVMPTAGLAFLTGKDAASLGAEFSVKTGLKLGDMGVVIYKDRWTPVMIGDGGPFMRLGEGSSRVFEAIGESRCKQWNAAGTTCVGTGSGAYPYKNFGLGSGVIFILYPGSNVPDLTPANALEKLCAFAKSKLALVGQSCPAN